MPERHSPLFALSVAATLAASAVGSAPAKEISLPPETILYRASDLPGYALVRGYCVLCHSADYVRYQPPAEPRSFWQAEVVKMQKKYGAPIADAQIDPIVEYLTKTYGSTSPASGAGPGAPNARG